MTTFVKLCALCDSTATLYFQCQSLLLLVSQHAQVVKPALGDTLCSVTATSTATATATAEVNNSKTEVNNSKAEVDNSKTEVADLITRVSITLLTATGKQTT